MSIRQREPAASEFGAGVVVCLAKFSEHLWGGPAFSERTLHAYVRWQEATPERRAAWQQEAARYPTGDAAEFMRQIGVAKVSEVVRGTPERVISHVIEMWMNGASDHFYDLDRERAPQPLVELADLTLTIGHGFTGQTWTMEHVEWIRELWKDSCMALDQLLGTHPEWGEV